MKPVLMYIMKFEDHISFEELAVKNELSNSTVILFSRVTPKGCTPLHLKTIVEISYAEKITFME